MPTDRPNSHELRRRNTVLGDHEARDVYGLAQATRQDPAAAVQAVDAALSNPQDPNSQTWLQWVGANARQLKDPESPLFKTGMQYGAVVSSLGTAIGQAMNSPTGKAVGAAVEALPAVAGVYTEVHRYMYPSNDRPAFNPGMAAGFAASAAMGGSLRASGEHFGGIESQQQVGGYLQGSGTLANMAGGALAQYSSNRPTGVPDVEQPPTFTNPTYGSGPVTTSPGTGSPVSPGGGSPQQQPVSPTLPPPGVDLTNQLPPQRLSGRSSEPKPQAGGGLPPDARRKSTTDTKKVIKRA